MRQTTRAILNSGGRCRQKLVAVCQKIRGREPGGPGPIGGLLGGVAGEDVGFDVDRVAGFEGAQAGGVPGVGDDGQLDLRGATGHRADERNREGDALDCNGALADDVAGEFRGELQEHAPVGRVKAVGVNGLQGEEGGDAIDVTLDDVAAEGRAGGSGEFEVDGAAGPKAAEGGAVEGLLGEVGGEVGGGEIERGEADAGDGDGVAETEAGGETFGSVDKDAGAAVGWGDGADGAVVSIRPVNMM